ncbi:uncharacterized protein PAC_01380 [Phialocephala subalpina]|uniref:Heterokaryon incompatibility domain-containing protein n=1 Tax=Phialocephala subalpina TaxID=576137 RepID=A0A1L7WFF0_9HELO|nr:uncharacterized protein PAC_01380 [Phialocephala subalpina]
MEFHLLPVHRGDPPIQVPRTQYVCTGLYDGGPWLSYPARKGKAEKFKDGTFDLMDYSRSERINPTPIKEQESFFQTWLYFGIIAEFMGVNSEDSINDPTSAEVIRSIYSEILDPDGDQTYVKLDVACLEKLLVMGRIRLSSDPVVRRQHYEHVIRCLAYMHPIIISVPDEFDYSIKWSIAALGELFMVSVRAALQALHAPSDFARSWGNKFLNKDAKRSMMEHGWCRSDIARAEAKYQGIQSLYIARMLDKSLPPRNHSQCTNSACKSYQINMGHYVSEHQHLLCSCETLVVEEEALLPALLDGDHYPLLRFEGGVGDLTCEIVKSGTKPYIAISHVWADGLGNPFANSLYRCKLHHLQKLVDAINDKESTTSPGNGERSLVWLDTLCCPAQDGDGKQKSIEKIRLVYRQAKHVLVLDAGLMSYQSQSQDASEIIKRIFTSSWMRRLWTLQEGALATSLYFQFADQAVNFSAVTQLVWAASTSKSMSYRALQPDFVNETRCLQAFFNNPTPLSLADSLNLLDRALQFRSVSVASDEPLCIATLLSFDLHAVLQLRDQESRMEKVWELVIAKHGGIPSQIIFFEEQKLSRPGWRWAPKTLLNSQSGLHGPNTRITRWFDPHLAVPEHPHGLRVKYPGVQISLKPDYGDGKPRNPWIGAPRLPEDWVQYRSLDDGRWYRIIDQKFAALNNSWTTDEERREYHKQGLYPVHDVANTGRSVLVLNNIPGVREALFATTVSEVSEFIEAVPAAVTTKLNAMLSDLKEESYIYDVVEKIALSVRADEVTDQHLALCKKLNIDENTSLDVFKDLLANHEDFIASTASVKEKIKEELARAVGDDEKFRTLIDTYWGVSYREDFWVVVRNFFHHDYVGKRTGDEQAWYID